VDGVDGCDARGQEQCLRELISMSKCRGVKVLIATQDVPSVTIHLASRSSLDLSYQRIPIESAILSLIRARITKVQALACLDASTQKRIETLLIGKADGKDG